MVVFIFSEIFIAKMNGKKVIIPHGNNFRKFYKKVIKFPLNSKEIWNTEHGKSDIGGILLYYIFSELS